jgi:hypothetical protein
MGLLDFNFTCLLILGPHAAAIVASRRGGSQHTRSGGDMAESGAHRTRSMTGRWARGSRREVGGSQVRGRGVAYRSARVTHKGHADWSGVSCREAAATGSYS